MGDMIAFVIADWTIFAAPRRCRFRRAWRLRPVSLIQVSEPRGAGKGSVRQAHHDRARWKAVRRHVSGALVE